MSPLSLTKNEERWAARIALNALEKVKGDKMGEGPNSGLAARITQSGGKNLTLNVAAVAEAWAKEVQSGGLSLAKLTEWAK